MTLFQDVWQHEAGHVGDIRNGGLVCASPTGQTVRAGAEAPCYASDMAHQVALARGLGG